MIDKLKTRIDELNDVDQQAINGTDYSFGFNSWKGGTLTLLRRLLPDDKDLINQIESIETKRVDLHRTDALAYNLEPCKNEAKEVLEIFIETLEDAVEGKKEEVTFWHLLHPRVAQLAKKRFENELSHAVDKDKNRNIFNDKSFFSLVFIAMKVCLLVTI